MKKQLLRLKQYGSYIGINTIDCDAIVGYKPGNMGNTETTIYLQGGFTVTSYEPSESFENRLRMACDPFINY